MAMHPSTRHRRPSEQGGITIVVALVLIVLMSLAAFSMSRNSIRQLASSGSILQGGKANEASEAGLDWYIVWGGAENQQASLAGGAGTGNYQLAQALYDMTHYPGITGTTPDWYTHLQSDGLLADSSASRTWDMAAAIRSSEANAASSDMVFDNTAATVLQSKNNTGNPVVQSFDLTIRYLGTIQPALTTNQSGASGNTNAGQTSVGELYYQITSLGKAAVPIGGGNYLRYQQRREMITSAPPF